jgi:hypothetical protein
MKTSIALILVLGLNIASAHANDSSFDQMIAQSILNTLQTQASHLDAEEAAALTQLNSARDNQSNGDSNSAAESRVAKTFPSGFVQAENIQLPIQTAGPIMGGDRDLYTFCPEGTEVRRHLATYLDLDGKTVQQSWGYPYCVSSADKSPNPAHVQGEINIQQLWISNWKQPILTLVLEGSDFKNNLDLNLDDLISGKITAAQILKAISPNN